MADPLGSLLDASRRGTSVVLSRSGSVLSRAPSAAGTVAVFGPDALRTVLSDIDTFGMPTPVSARYELPPPLANLNSALFSMTGPAHRGRQRLLANLMGPGRASQHRVAIERGLAAWLADTAACREITLIHEMRRLARFVAEEVLFGSVEREAPLGVEIQRYFELRRRYASRGAAESDGEALEALVAQGTRVDARLRSLVRAARRRAHGSAVGVVGELCRFADDPTLGLTEDELVAHANILFMSSSEPIATAMTWIVLTLTQHPDLRAAIRDEPDADGETAPPLLGGTVREVLRLVPPSAILVRLTRRGANVAGLDLLPNCEVIVSPFVEHRRSPPFEDPDVLWPSRWSRNHPGPYEFLPFGAGARACLGRRIALATLEQGTRAILARADPVLARPQELDWRMNLTLLPSSDPVVRIVAPRARPEPGPRLSGPAARLLTPRTRR